MNRTLIVFGYCFVLVGTVACDSKLDERSGKGEVTASDRAPIAESTGTSGTEGAQRQDDVASSAHEPATLGPPVLQKAEMNFAMRDGRNVIVVDAAAVDAEGKPADVVCEWVRDGRVIAEGLEFGDFERGDKIEIVVRAYDGFLYGTPRTLPITIRNSPPVLSMNPAFTFDGTLYQQQVKAEDPDGDEVTFELTKTPEGMTIDRRTGRITWTVPADVTGKVDAAVVASDGQGGKTKAEFSVELKTEPGVATGEPGSSQGITGERKF